MGLDVQEQGGDHGHGLLAADAAGAVLALEQLVDGCQGLQLAQLRARVGQLPGQLVGVPGDGARLLQLLPVDLQNPPRV